MLRSALSNLSIIALLSACAPALSVSALGGANGMLDAGDLTLDSGEYYETYSYAGRGGDLLTISLVSTEIDPYLMVLDPEGEKLAEIDDSAGHGYDVLVSVSLPVTGSYTILVTSAFPGETGAFELNLNAGSRISPDSDSGSPLTPTSPGRDGSWVPSGAADNGSMASIALI